MRSVTPDASLKLLLGKAACFSDFIQSGFSAGFVSGENFVCCLDEFVFIGFMEDIHGHHSGKV